jgi:hypothetical protein
MNIFSPATRLGFLLAAVWFVGVAPRQCRAQNDWQYPDPYFGILEIEKSHDRATTRRYREEVNPAPRSSRYAAPSAWQAPAGDAAGTATATPSATPTAAMPAPVTRPRWRNRWRR